MSLSAIGASAPTTQTLTGSITGTSLGDGNFSKLITTEGNTRTIDATFQFAGGRSVTRDTTITHNANGTLSEAIATTLANGKTVTRSETWTPQSGGWSISGTGTGPNGAADQISGTVTPTADGNVQALTLTDAAGASATQTLTTVNNAATSLALMTGTNFSGAQFSTATAQTLIGAQAASA